jgi:biopolymer transport protein ExbB/TolQ
MIGTFEDGGLMMWPLLLVALGILWIAGRTAVRLREAGVPREDVGRSLNTLLFWGAMALVLGTLGTTVGLVQMAKHVQAAGTASASLVAAGFSVTLITLIFGLLIALLAGLLWLPLHFWRRRGVEGGEPA